MEKIYDRIAALFPPRYCPDFNITQPRLRSSGRRGAQGVDYVRKVSAKLELSEIDLSQREAVLRAFVQPERRFQTFIPGLCLRSFFRSVMEGDVPQGVYKGVSYNPSLVQRGERMDNFDFFSWAKQVQEQVPEFQLTVLDASPYQVINELGELKFPEGLDEEGFANWFYDQILEGLEGNPVLKENCRLRGQYLEALRKVSGVAGRVVSVEGLMRTKDPQLMRAFIEAKRLCGLGKSADGTLSVDRFVDYRRYDTSFAKTYTPAVVAEALYFLETTGILGKLGPTSELAFDNLIAEAMRERGSDYNFFWYTRPFEKTSSANNRIFFSDSDEEIQRKAGTEGYGAWLGDITENLSSEKDLIDRIIGLRDRVMAELQ